MMQAQELLDRIALLRKRFQPSTPAGDLSGQVEGGVKDHQLLDTALRPLAVDEEGPLPVRLSHRSRRLLKEGRELLTQLRALADEPLLHFDSADAVAKLYHETAAILDTAMRTIQAFPASSIAQARLCDGLEPMLAIVAERIDVIKVGLDVRKQETRTMSTLAELLAKLASGELTTIQDFLPIANGILEDARANKPLRFLHGDAKEPPLFVAAHSLTVAQVVARLIQGDPEYRGRIMEPVLAALVEDVAMVLVGPEILASTNPLDDTQRRTIESHTLRGAEILKQLGPSGSWLAEPALKHHERLDGSGYPAGLKADELPALVRLLSIGDVYVALASKRPHRDSLESRTALTETLLLADRGALDRNEAERLLNISFYPVGSVVEFADGAIGVVTGVNKPDKDFFDPARPIVALLQENDLPLAAPKSVNLREERDRSILRALDANERRLMMCTHYPALA